MEISKFESLQGWRFGRKDVWVDKRKQVRKDLQSDHFSNSCFSNTRVPALYSFSF